MKPTLVYYLQFKDESLRIPNWNSKQDYVCCVMAENAEQAIEKTKAIAGGPIKIMGIANGKLEWVNENAPL